MVDDAQTHLLPLEMAALDNVARLHGAVGGEALLAELRPHVERAGTLFDSLAPDTSARLSNDPDILSAELKTLGFTRRRVLSIFISESVALALAGGLLGIVAAVPVIAGLTHRFIGLGVPLYMRVNAPVAGLSLLVALILGVVSGYLPADRVSRLNIVDALRHIG